MATTKSIRIKGAIALSKVIDYVTDRKKVVDENYVDTINCSVELAEQEFALIRNMASLKLENFGYHLIQSFPEFENISAEEVNLLGKKTIEKAFGDDYQCIIATHQDKKHLHNHIVINSVSMKTGRAFKNQIALYKSFKKASDEICREYGLSVIEKTNKEINNETSLDNDEYIINIKGKDYKKKLKSDWTKTSNEKYAINRGVSWKYRIKKIIDTGIRNSESWEEFLEYCKSKNLDIKDINKSGNEYKHISFCLSKDGQERQTRGSTIGSNYTREKIKERINNNRIKNEKFRNTSTRTKIINTVKEKKFIENEALKSWAVSQNIENISKVIVQMKKYNINNIEDLNEVISNKVELNNDMYKKINDYNLDLNQYKFILKQKRILSNNKKYSIEYKKNPNSKYYNKYRKEIENYNKAYQSITKEERAIDLKELKSKIEELEKELLNINNSLENSRNEIKELKQMKADLEAFMQIEEPEKDKNREKSL